MAKVLQHTVPDFYLRSFTPPTGQKCLWAYSKNRPHPHVMSPKKATTHKHVYSDLLKDGSWDETLEDSFGRIETATASPLKELANGHPPGRTERWAISFFMALMWYRPYGLRAHADAQAEALATPDGTIAYIQSRPDIYDAFSREAVDEYIEKVRNEGRGVRMPKNFHLVNLFERASHVAVSIFAMSWTVEHSVPGSFFITSDNPVLVRRAQNILDPGLVGFDRDDLEAEMGFPLSRETFLIARWRGPRFQYQRSPK
jgi:hypothetical protein